MSTTKKYNLPILSNEGGLSVYLGQIKQDVADSFSLIMFFHFHLTN